MEVYPWGLYDAYAGVAVGSCGRLNSEAMYTEEPAKLLSALFLAQHVQVQHMLD